MRYQIERDDRAVAKFAIKLDAVKYARLVGNRKGVEKVVIVDKRENTQITF